MGLNVVMDAMQSEKVASAIEELVVLFKIDEKIDRLCERIVEGIENDRNSIPAFAFDKYKEIVFSSFESSALKQDIRKIMSANYDAEKYSRFADFLKHPKILAMSQYEEDAKSLDAVQEMQDFFSGLQMSPPTEDRKHLIEKIDDIKHSSSTVIDAQVDLFQAIIRGTRGLRGDDQKISEVQLGQAVLDMEKELGGHIKRQIWISMLYAYKNVSDSDLEAYLASCETVSARSANEFMRAVYLEMHKNVVNGLQHELALAFNDCLNDV